MKLSLFTKIGMGVVGALFLAWAAFMLFVNGDDARSKSVITDPNRCPVCGHELPPAYRGTGECPYCAAAHPGVGATIHTGRTAASNPLVPVFLIGLFCILLGVNLFVTFRKIRIHQIEEGIYHLQCPKCGRKLRYRESQAGRLAACPLCHRPIVFPRLLRPETRWTRMKRWLGMASR
jgi:hypothetical protein